MQTKRLNTRVARDLASDEANAIVTMPNVLNVVGTILAHNSKFVTIRHTKSGSSRIITRTIPKADVLVVEGGVGKLGRVLFVTHSPVYVKSGSYEYDEKTGCMLVQSEDGPVYLNMLFKHGQVELLGESSEEAPAPKKKRSTRE
jgi:hypothetical protein